MEDQIVRLDALAHLLCVSKRRIQQLAAQGLLIRGKQGQYPLADNVRAYIQHLETANSNELHQLRTETAKRQLAREQARQRVKDGELIDRSAFDAFALALTRAAEKGASSLDRHLVPVFRDVAKVNAAIDAYHAVFFPWLEAAHTLALRGATVADINELFASYGTPADAKSAVRRKPRKTELSDDD